MRLFLRYHKQDLPRKTSFPNRTCEISLSLICCCCFTFVINYLFLNYFLILFKMISLLWINTLFIFPKKQYKVKKWTTKKTAEVVLNRVLIFFNVFIYPFSYAQGYLGKQLLFMSTILKSEVHAWLFLLLERIKF